MCVFVYGLIRKSTSDIIPITSPVSCIRRLASCTETNPVALFLVQKELWKQLSRLSWIKVMTLFYRHAASSTLKPLDSVYHSALGFIAGVGYNCQHCLLHDMVGWSSLEKRWNNHWFLFIFKALLGKLPPYIYTMLHQYVNPYLTQSNDWFVF